MLRKTVHTLTRVKPTPCSGVLLLLLGWWDEAEPFAALTASREEMSLAGTAECIGWGVAEAVKWSGRGLWADWLTNRSWAQGYSGSEILNDMSYYWSGYELSDKQAKHMDICVTGITVCITVIHNSILQYILSNVRRRFSLKQDNNFLIKHKRTLHFLNA